MAKYNITEKKEKKATYRSLVSPKLMDEMKERILDVPLGQTVWVGPVSGAEMYGFENKNTPRGYLIAAWRAVDVRFGECRIIMLIDQAAFDRLFSALEDGKSTRARCS